MLHLPNSSYRSALFLLVVVYIPYVGPGGTYITTHILWEIKTIPFIIYCSAELSIIDCYTNIQVGNWANVLNCFLILMDIYLIAKRGIV